MLGNTYGWRARIGIILPSLNVTTEPEYYRMLPEGVTLHTTRIFIEQETEESFAQLAGYVTDTVSLLSHARVDALAFACTSGSLYGGVGYDQKIIDLMRNSINLPCTTTSTAVLEAMRALGMQKICVVTPYSSWINPKEQHFLEANGFCVTNIKSIREEVSDIFHGIENDTGPRLSFLVNAITPQRVYKFTVDKVYTNDCDGVFLSCMGLPTLGIIKTLEEDIGKPVISSNQVTLWKLLKMAGVKTESMKCYGSLFCIN